MVRATTIKCDLCKGEIIGRNYAVAAANSAVLVGNFSVCYDIESDGVPADLCAACASALLYQFSEGVRPGTVGVLKHVWPELLDAAQVQGRLLHINTHLRAAIGLSVSTFQKFELESARIALCKLLLQVGYKPAAATPEKDITPGATA